jgi:hypothetical protein
MMLEIMPSEPLPAIYLEIELLRQHPAQIHPAVGIPVETAQSPADGFHRERRRAQRVLVRCKFANASEAEFVLDLFHASTGFIGPQRRDIRRN